MDISVTEIAKRVEGAVVGDGNVRITGVSSLTQAGNGDLTFVARRRNLRLLKTTRASAVLVSPDVMASDKTLIVVGNPYLAFAKVLRECCPSQYVQPEGIHPTAVVCENVHMGNGVSVGPHAYVGADCSIGDKVVVYSGVYIGPGSRIGNGTIIYPNVVVGERIEIGARCVIHGGTVLGADGFGFTAVDGVHHKMPQVGTVVLGDDVEIGANTAIDRATLGHTVIGKGTKIDNQVQIGHNVEIGEHCIISGKVGICGSVIIGNRVTIAAAVGINGHLEIGDGAIIGALAGVTKSIGPGEVVSGFPARSHAAELRRQACVKGLPDAMRLVRELERRVQELEGQVNGKPEDDS